MIRRTIKAMPGRVWKSFQTWVQRAAIILAKRRSATGDDRTAVHTSHMATTRVHTARPAGMLLLAVICVMTISASGLTPALVAPTADSAATEQQEAEDPDLSTPADAGIQSTPTQSSDTLITPAYDLGIQDSEDAILVRGMPSNGASSTDSDADDALPSPTPEPTPEPTPQPTPTPIVYPTVYTVQSGDTLWGITEKMYDSVDYVSLITYANGLSYHDPIIYAGQNLEILDPSTVIPAPTPAPQSIPVAAPAAPAPTAPPPVVTAPSTAPTTAGYSAEDVDLYLKIVASEAGAGWSYNGALMIAQVIVNRVHDGRWGGLRGVLTASNQFTPYATGYYRNAVATPTQRQAALDALNGATIFSRKVLYFCTDQAYARSSWFQSLPVASRYANTIFMMP